MKRVIAMLMILVVFGSIATVAYSTEANKKDSKEAREIKMAEMAILVSLMISRNPSSQYLCSQNDYACMGVNQAELGLSLISSRSSEISLAGLAKLLRYRFDAGLSEDFHCYTLGKRRTMLKYLNAIDSAKLERQCNFEVKSILNSNKDKFNELNIESICSDQKEIKERQNELLGAIKNGVQCDSTDF